jgi:hypothetical protein
VEKPVRELREMTSSTSGGSEGGVMSVDLGDSDTREFLHPLPKYPRRWP